MFALPETKRVRRTKLFESSPSSSSSSSSSHPPPTPNSALHLDFDFITVAPAEDPQPPPDDDLDFQLFSTTQKITLKDPTPPPSSEDAWELQAQLQKRPAIYYVLTGGDMVTRRQELQFSEVVVSAEDIIKGAKTSWPGCRVPWKVTTIKAAAVVPQGKGSGKCVKPGKQRRVYLRKKEQKRKEVEEARLKAIEGRKKFAGLPKEEREVKEREERNKKNREKKVKRRIREKAKKEAARATSREANDGSMSGSESENENGGEGVVDE